MTRLFLVVAVVLITGMAVGVVSCGGTASLDDALDMVGPSVRDGKVAMCHVPPGNPANMHTIHISEHAVSAHLAHGDFVGPCGGPSVEPDGGSGEEPDGGACGLRGDPCETSNQCCTGLACLSGRAECSSGASCSCADPIG